MARTYPPGKLPLAPFSSLLTFTIIFLAMLHSGSLSAIMRASKPMQPLALLTVFFWAMLRYYTKHPSGYAIPLMRVQAEKADEILKSL
jgi:hypothetical membrane protein